MDPGDGKTHKVSHEEFKDEWTGVLVLISPGEKFSVRNEKVPIFVRLWQLIKPNIGILVPALVGALFFSILGLSMSLYVGRLVDHVIPAGNTESPEPSWSGNALHSSVQGFVEFFPILFCFKNRATN